MPNKLTVKQEAFCMHYAKTGNATESYCAAGYESKSKKSASASAARLLANVKVQERLQEIAQEIKSNKIADITEIQEYLTSVMRREKQESVVVTVSEKHSYYAPDEKDVMRKFTNEVEVPKIVEIPAKLSDANKAAETLAKMQGAFGSKLEVELTVPVFEGEEALED